MAEITLTQAEADALIAIDKRRVDEKEWVTPDFGGKCCVPLISSNNREHFQLDISRGRINLSKGTNQLRGRQIISLVRLDYGGAPHRNPDEQEIRSPHIHLYREGYSDKWAYEVPPTHFSNLNDPWIILTDFFAYCNVTLPPRFNKGLFS